jgi:medium-chain acyl-[acyl-carrier-protein] hydrolase
VANVDRHRGTNTAHDRSPARAPWFVHAASHRQPEWRILCFAHAGAGPSAFRDWPPALPASVDVCAVHLPGRGSRLAEAPYTRLVPLAGAVAEAIIADRCGLLRTAQRFALFGHSLGALLAFEVARELRRRDGPRPSLLACAGCHAPQIRPSRSPIHHLPPSELLQRIRDLNGSPADVLANRELMEVLLPSLRADFEMYETYEHRREHRLGVPIVAFAGANDREVRLDDVAAWREQTSASFRLHVLPGDHFFLGTAREQLLRVIVGCLS